MENKIGKNTRVIQKYADKMILGDTEAKIMLIDYYFELAYKLYKEQFANISIENDDLKQMAYLSVLNGINNYKSEFTYFSTYISNYIKNFVNRKAEQEQNCIDAIPVGLNITLEDNYENYFKSLEKNDLINNAIKKLSKRNQEILYLYFYEQKSLDSIAKIYDVSISRVQQVIHINLGKIKGELLYYKTLDKLKSKGARVNSYNFILLYFKDYAKEEIDNAINSLTEYTKIKLKQTSITNTYDPRFYTILKKIENILIEERRKASLKTNKCKKIVRK